MDEAKVSGAPLSSDGEPEFCLPLTRRQQAFVEEFIVDLNGAAAAIRAGYSPIGAKSAAVHLLGKPHVAAAVQRLKEQRAARTRITQDAVVHETSLLALSDVSHYVITQEGHVSPAEGAPEGCMRAIQSIKRKTKVHRDKDGTVTCVEHDVELRLWDKPAPLKLLGRHVGLFPNKVEISSPDLDAALKGATEAELAARAAALSAKAAALAGELAGE